MLKTGNGEAEKFILGHFLNRETGLIYDFLVDRSNAWHHLPLPADIAKQDPNPCGWGTGMEDSVLNTGSLLDALIAEYAVRGDPDGDLRPLASLLFSGLLRCADCASDRGFIARSVSPFDGKSHYINSSRDQYTHWVYSAVRYFDSPLSSEEEKRGIVRVLTEIARKCERDVTEANGFNLLREDGQTGMVCQMWGELGAHEYLRLPMFYLAAYHVGGDPHWREKYLEYRDEALEKSLPFVPGGRCYPTLQMQYSLRMIYDLDPDPVFREKCVSLMQRLAEHCEKWSIDGAKRLIPPAKRDELRFVYKKWSDTDMRDVGHYGGYIYLNPAQSELPENAFFYDIRDVGEAASVAALCPGRKVPDSVTESVVSLADALNYENHYSFAPLLLACGYRLCLENRAQSDDIPV